MAVYVQVKKPLTHALRIAAAIIVVFISAGLLARFASRQNSKPHEIEWHVYFSPGGGCASAIVQKIGEAKNSVFIQAYSFTSVPIAKALADSKKRGVTISVILDNGQKSDQQGEAHFLSRADIRTLIDDTHASNHNKVIVIDGETVITGSYNFTIAAEDKNAENLLIIRDRALAQRYTENWYIHAAHSKPFLSK